MTLTNQQLEQRLYELPHEKFKSDEKIAQLWLEWSKLEAEYENLMDKEYLSLKAINEDMTIKELEAATREKCYAKRLECIHKKAELERFKNISAECEMKFQAILSGIKLRVSEIQLTK